MVALPENGEALSARESVVGHVKDRSVTYLSLHQVRAGQGGQVHIAAVCDGLRSRGWRVRMIDRSTLGPLGRVPVVAHLLTQCRAITRGHLYVRHHPAAFVVVTLSRVLGANVVLEVNGTHEDMTHAHPTLTPLSRLILWLDTLILRQASSVIAVSDHLANLASTRTGRPVDAVPNGVDITRFRPVAGTNRGGRVAFVGALAPWQGLESLIQAVSQPGWPQGVQVLVAGAGPMEGRVLEAARENTLLTYLGSVAHSDVPALLSRCLAVVSPKDESHAAASPLKVLEAMAMALPVVATDVGEQGRLVREGRCGILVQPQAPSQLAEAVARLAGDPQLAEQLGRNGRRLVEDRYTWAEVLDAIEVRLGEG